MWLWRDILRALLRFLMRAANPFFLLRIPRRQMSAPSDSAPPWWDEPHWYRAGRPPRQGNTVTVLIDGRAAMLDMYKAMYEATSSIWLADWALAPAMEVVRGVDQASVASVPDPTGAPSYRLSDLLAFKARTVEVRVLLWQGLLFFRPRRFLVYQAREALRAAHPSIRMLIDASERFGTSHHQKVLVVDGRIAYISGLDFTNFDADRWDTQRHDPRSGRNWHDVCGRVEGPCVADVARNFAERWSAAGGGVPTVTPAPDTLENASGQVAQIVRTIPGHTYHYAREGDRGVEHSYLTLIDIAERYLYIENQYLWSPVVIDHLIKALERPRSGPFQIAIVLPVRPNIGKTDTDRAVRRLLAADHGRGRVHCYVLYTWGRSRWRDALVYKPIYVHAKLMIADDRWFTIGSANLNTRSLVSDTELNVLVDDATGAQRLRLGLWSEHLLRSEEELAVQDPVTMLGHEWPRLARLGGSRLRRRREPLPARIVPYPLGFVRTGIVSGLERGGISPDHRR